MTKEQLELLILYIDQAIDAKFEYMEPGPDGYHGNSGRDERLRRELADKLRDSFSARDGQ